MEWDGMGWDGMAEMEWDGADLHHRVTEGKVGERGGRLLLHADAHPKVDLRTRLDGMR
jgi:hypothetical protein